MAGVTDLAPNKSLNSANSPFRGAREDLGFILRERVEKKGVMDGSWTVCWAVRERLEVDKTEA
jgi:cobalamin biosynthesis protein CobT